MTALALLSMLAAATAMSLRPAGVDDRPDAADPAPAPQSFTGHGDDFIVLGRDGGAPGLLSAVHHGHFPAYPEPVGAITGWNWSGTAIDANTSVQTGGDIAYGRDGVAYAVYTTFYPNGTISCLGNPETRYRGDLLLKKWNGTWGPGAVIMPGDDDVSFFASSIAYDASGNVLVSFGRTTLLRDGDGCGAGSIGSLQYGLWRGVDLAMLAGPAMLWAPSPPPFPKLSEVVFIPQLAPPASLTVNKAIIAYDQPVQCPPLSTLAFWFRLNHADWGGSGITVQGPVPGSPGSMNAFRTIFFSTSKFGETVGVYGINRDPDAFVAPCDPDGDEVNELWHARWDGAAWTAGALDQTDFPTEAAISYQFNDTATIVYTKDTGAGPDLWYTFFHWGPLPFKGLLSANAQAPKIASDHHDRTVAVWQGGGGVRNSTLTAAGWGPIGLIPTIVDAAAIASHASSPSTPLAEWSFFAYMCEDTYPPLWAGGPAGQVDLAEMNLVGTSAQFNAAAYLDKNGTAPDVKIAIPRLGGDLGYSNSRILEVIDLMRRNFATPDNLSNAVGFFLEAWPSNHTALDIWDHGLGWQGVCWDAQNTWATGDDQFLNMTELSQGLSDALGASRLDVLAFDACCMANLEALHQIRNFADYAGASETVEPDPGWAYDDIFADLKNNWRKSPRDLTAALVTHYRNEYLNNNLNSQAEMFSAIDLARMRTGTLAGAVNSLGIALDTALAAQFTAINGSVQNASETDCGCPPPSVDLVLDLKNLSKEYRRRVPVAAVQAAAQSVIDEVPNVAYAYWNGSGGDNRPAGWNATKGTDYFGISIYHTNGSYDPDYNATAFATGSFWDVYIWNFNQMMNGGPVIAPEFGSAVVAVATLVSLPLLLARRRRSRKGNSP